MTRADGSRVAIADLKNIDERLDLWGGVASSFVPKWMGSPVRVRTVAHPRRDEVAVSVESAAGCVGPAQSAIGVSLRLRGVRPDYQDWKNPILHRTVVTRRGTSGADFRRALGCDALLRSRQMDGRGVAGGDGESISTY